MKRLRLEGTGLVARGQLPHPLEHLGLAGRRGDLKGVALEAGGVPHARGALRQQGDDLLVERVDALAQLGQRGGGRHIGRILEAAHRWRIGDRFGGH